MKTQRLNISFPKEVADSLSSLVPPGKRSRLVVEATERELRKVRLLRTLERTAGAWTEVNHPELKTIEDVRAWVEDLRRSDEDRSFHNRTRR